MTFSTFRSIAIVQSSVYYIHLNTEDVWKSGANRSGGACREEANVPRNLDADIYTSTSMNITGSI